MPRCDNCNTKFEAYEFNGKFCKELDCQVQKALFLVAKDRTNKKKKQAEKIKEIDKDCRERKKKLYPKKHRALLQDQINLLARKIDERFYTTCIDCDTVLRFDKVNMVHGAHRSNVGGHENIRFNLHNIHSATLPCNKWSSEHKVGYDKGLINRYGQEYHDLVHGLNLKYKSIHLSTAEIDSALKIARKLNRDFKTMVFTDSISARNILNNIIGIYK